MLKIIEEFVEMIQIKKEQKLINKIKTKRETATRLKELDYSVSPSLDKELKIRNLMMMHNLTRGEALISYNTPPVKTQAITFDIV